MADITQGVRIAALVTGASEVLALNRAIDATIEKVGALNSLSVSNAGVAETAASAATSTAQIGTVSGNAAKNVEALAIASGNAAAGIELLGIASGNAEALLAALAIAAGDAAAAIELTGSASATTVPIFEALATSSSNAAAGMELIALVLVDVAPLLESMALTTSTVAASFDAISASASTAGNGTSNIRALGIASADAAVGISDVGFAAATATPFIAALGTTASTAATGMASLSSAAASANAITASTSTTAAAASAGAAGLYAQIMNNASAYGRFAGNSENLIQSLVAQAAAIRTSGASLEVQKLQLVSVQSALQAQIELYAGMGASGVAAANMTGDALIYTKAQINAVTADMAALTAVQKTHATVATDDASAQLAMAEATLASTTSLQAQRVLLMQIAAGLEADIAAYVAMGEAGIVAAELTGVALTQTRSQLALVNTQLREQITLTETLSATQLRQIAVASGAGRQGASALSLLANPTTAALLLGGGLAFLGVKAINLAADLERLSMRTGINVKDLSVLNVAAKEAGMNIESLGMVFRKLNMNIDAALHGVPTAIRNFKEALKIDTNANLMSWIQNTAPIDKLHQLATALDAIPNAEERIAKAQEIMGARGGTGSSGAANLLLFLHQLAGDGFAKVTEEATRLGVVIDESTGQRALQFQQQWARVKLELMGVGTTIATALLPALSQLTDALAPKKIDSTVESFNAFSVTIKVLASAMSGLVATVQILMQLTPGFVVLADTINRAGGGAGFIDAKQRTDMLKSMVSKSWDAMQNASNAFVQTWVPGAGEKPPGLLDHLGHDDVIPKGDPAKDAEALVVAKDLLAVAEAQRNVALSTTATDALRLEHNVKLLEIQKQLDQHKRTAIGKTNEKDLDTVYDATAAAERIAENAKYNDARLKLNGSETERLRALRSQLEILKMQTAEEGHISGDVKQRLDYDIKHQQIESDRLAQLSAVDRTKTNEDPFVKKQDDLIKSTAAQKQTQNDLAYAAAVTAQAAAVTTLAKAHADEARQMELVVTQSENAYQVAKLTAELEIGRRASIATIPDIQRTAQTQLLAGELDFQSKRKAIVVAADKEIAALDLEARASQAWIDKGVGNAEDVATVVRDNAAIAAVKKKMNSDVATARVATESAANKITFDQLVSMQNAIDAMRGDSEAMRLALMIAGYEKEGTEYSLNMARALKATLKIHLDVIDQVRAHWKSVFDEVGNSFGTIFDSLLKGGKLSDALKSVGQGFQKIFTNDIQAQINLWLTNLYNASQGLDANGHVIPGGVTGSQYGPAAQGAMGSAEQKKAQRMGYAAQIAGAGVSGYAAGQGNGSATTAAAGAFISGAMTGNIYVAVAAAIVSLIGSAISGAQKRAEYQFGIPIISNGKAMLVQEQNLTPAKVTAMEAQIQKVFNDSWNGFVNVMLKLPGSNVPSVPEMMNGSFQDNPSAHWAEHFQTYLSDTLPRDVAKVFYDGMRVAFTGAMTTLVHGPVTEDVKNALGLQFSKFWEEASTLDATTRLQFWSDLADGLASFSKALERVAHVAVAASGDLSKVQLNPEGWQHQFGDSDFVTTLKAGTQGIFDQAKAMVSLTGPDRVAAFKALGASVNAVTKSLVDYINHIADVLRQLKQSFSDAAYQHALSRAGEVKDANGNIIHQAEPNAQARIMEAEYNKTINQIQNAKKLGLTADEVQTLTNKAIGLLNDIYALDPTAAADAWWQKQMGILQDISTKSLNELGTAAKSAVDRLIAQVQPFVDWFNGLPVDLDAAMKLLTGPDGAFAGFADALDALTHKINDTKPVVPNPGTGGNGGNGGAGDKPGDGPGDKKNSIGEAPAVGDTYNFSFGNVYSTDDINTMITESLRTVAQGNPKILQRKFT